MNLFNTKQKDGTPLFIFRIGFGLLLTFSGIHILENVIRTNTITGRFINLSLFSWLSLPSAPLLITLAALFILASICFTLGYKLRITSLSLMLISIYFFLTHFDRYNNHYYLIILLLGIMAFTHADKGLSIQNKKTSSIPEWEITLLKLQCIIPYIYSSISKGLDIDWRSGVLISNKLNALGYHSLLGPIVEAIPIGIIAKSIIFFDFAIAILLFFTRPQIWVSFLFLLFHGLNHFVVFSTLTLSKGSVGIFPILGNMSLILFWDKESLMAAYMRIKQRLSFSKSPLFKQKESAAITPSFIISMLSILFLTLYPLHYYFDYSHSRWSHNIIGTWTNHSTHKTGNTSVYYMHNQLNKWVPFQLPQGKMLPIHSTAIYSPKGHYALLKYTQTEMREHGFFMDDIAISSEIILNNRIKRSFNKIIKWTDVSPDIFKMK